MPLPLVTFWFGPGSRYSYLASTQMMGLQIECGVRVEWVPVASALLMARAGYTPFAGAPPARQYEIAWRAEDAARWAAVYGVPYRDPADLPIDGERLALACWAARRLDAGQVFARALMRRIFVEGIAPDDAALAETAEEIGKTPDDILGAIDAPETRAAHEAAIEAAVAAGAFGVPTFRLGDGPVFWGQDRLPLLRHAIKTGAGS